jgi:hypothetical protein
VDHLSRLTLWLLALVVALLLSAPSAHAYGTVPMTSSTTVNGYWVSDDHSLRGLTPDAAAQAYGSSFCAGAAGQSWFYGCKGIFWVDVNVSFKWEFYTNSGHTSTGLTLQHYLEPGSWTEQGTCPSNSTLTGTTCTCNSGFRPNGSTCEAYTCQKQNVSDSEFGPYSSKTAAMAAKYLCTNTTNPYLADKSGCLVEYDAYAAKQGPDGNWYAYTTGYTNGGFCDPNVAGTGSSPSSTGSSSLDSNGVPVAPAPPETCGLGKCPGVVNGTSVCVACGTTTGTGGTTTTTNGSGATTGTSSTTTDCTGGTCFSSTTTKDGSGNVTGTTVTSMPQSTFCATHPGDPACKAAGSSTGSGTGSGEGDESAFGGTCGAFSCDGDAVQCAIALEQHKRDCAMFDTTTPESQAYETAKAAGSKPSDHPGNDANVTTVDMSGGFNQNDIIGGSCPGDYTVATVRGSPLVLPLSKLCTPAEWLGNLLVGLTALACVGIVFVKGS